MKLTGPQVKQLHDAILDTYMLYSLRIRMKAMCTIAGADV